VGFSPFPSPPCPRDPGSMQLGCHRALGRGSLLGLSLPQFPCFQMRVIIASISQDCSEMKGAPMCSRCEKQNSKLGS
jgi:hypothetical protein